MVLWTSDARSNGAFSITLYNFVYLRVCVCMYMTCTYNFFSLSPSLSLPFPLPLSPSAVTSSYCIMVLQVILVAITNIPLCVELPGVF